MESDLNSKMLTGLRNTRDLRAEILDMAAALLTHEGQYQLEVIAPLITTRTVWAEWERLLPALAPGIRERLSLSVSKGKPVATVGRNVAPLDRPNYRYEALRLLLASALGVYPPSNLRELIGRIGASQTPVRAALSALRDAEIVQGNRPLQVDPESLSSDLLSRIGALPQQLRFRFERGTQIKTPSTLLGRARALLGDDGPKEWRSWALSGVPVAHVDVPMIDLVGIPRIDLIAHAGRGTDEFQACAIGMLDDGLELEPNMLAPAPVVLTLVRADVCDTRTAGSQSTRCACANDVLLALYDAGLREQAIQYARAMRR